VQAPFQRGFPDAVIARPSDFDGRFQFFRLV
jgi:hypothetical protein